MLNGQPTVLVVDDDELLRDVTTIMIEDHGGTVITARDGGHGVDVFRENANRISVVFLDYSMPVRNGYEALIEMRKIKPGIKAVIVSGLSITPEIATLRERGEVVFLSKPFRENDLINCLNSLLSPAKEALA